MCWWEQHGVKEVDDAHHDHDHQRDAARFLLGVLDLRIRRLVVWREVLAVLHSLSPASETE